MVSSKDAIFGNLILTGSLLIGSVLTGEFLFYPIGPRDEFKFTIFYLQDKLGGSKVEWFSLSLVWHKK